MKHYGFLVLFLFVVIQGPIISDLPLSTGKIENFTLSTLEYINRDPIQVLNDSSFEILGFPGNGTVSDPYVIENYAIEVNETSGPYYGIEISGTEKHFVIRNCLINGDNSSLSSYGYCIYLNNTSNGQIVSNHFQELQTLIKIQGNVTNLTIRNNQFQGGDVYRGLLVGGPNANIRVQNNTFTSIQEAIFVSSQGLDVIDNNLISCDKGIYLYSASENMLSGNFIDQGFVGLVFQDSDSNHAAWNLLSGNSIGGILEVGSDDNILTNNTFSPSQIEDEPVVQGIGLRIRSASTNNSIIWNDFVDNVISIKNDVEGNYYDFNYFSDYSGFDGDGDFIGDTPYYISGDFPTQDDNPRMYLIGFVPTTSPGMPVDQMGLIFIVGAVGVVGFISILVVIRKTQHHSQRK